MPSQENSSMLFHRETFLFLRYIGVWKPQNLPKWKSILYNIYSTVTVTLIMTFCLSQFSGIILSKSANVKALMQNMFLALTTMCICLKIINLFCCRSKLINILEMLTTHPFECQSSEEYSICYKFSRRVRCLSILSIAYIVIAPLYFAIEEVLGNLAKRTLPFSGWFPYDYSSPSVWWCISLYLAISLYLEAVFNIVYNALFFELMMRIVAQVKILKHRLQVMMTDLGNAMSENSAEKHLLLERHLFRDCVEYHVVILRMAKDINSIFATIMMIQYLITSLVLSSTVYLMSETMLASRDFLKLTVYFLSMFQQIFMLCYAGHCTYLEFDSIGDVLYTCNWMTLSENSKQSMKLLLVNAKKPFVFDCGGLLKLDMEAFKNTLMFAYSIYNIF
ncbi:odorant receptor 33a [Diachasma alloeum]|uniref:Odorant receptor n=1 Tax=Diachasma alloeum TaxID=454923 RepID=A0A4E0S4I5_9HYME|nr:odorant receptor 33a [Diachasma alloeum]THK33093.1 odorant receptor 105 [Diachasma alloeum]